MNLLATLTNPVLNNNVGSMVSSADSVDKTSTLIQNAIEISLGVGAIICFFIIIRGGYIYMTSAGDKEASQRGSKTITSGMIGLAILFSLFAIINLMEQLFGVSLMKIKLPTLF